MKLSIIAGATSQSVNILIQNSGSTTGAGLTGLVFNTSGLTAYYSFAGANATSTAITLATLSLVSSAWATAGFKEIDAVNMPGVYRFDIPNAVIAASKGRSVIIYFQGAASMAPCVLEIELTGWDNQNATTGGLGALPATACTTNASLLTSGTGTDQLSVSSGKVLLQATQTGVTIPTVTTVGTLTTYTGDTPQTGDSYARIGVAGVGLTNVVLPSGGLANVTAWTVAITGNIAGNLSGSVGSVTGAVGSVTGSVTVSGDFSATMKTSIGTAVAASAVASVTGSVGSIAGVTFPTGFSTLTVAAIQTGLATPTNITAGTITTTTNLTNAPTSGDFTAAMKTSLNAATPASVQNLAAQTGDSYAVVNSGTFGNAVLASGLAMAISDISAIPTDPITSLAGIATSTNISSLQTHGDSTWATATGFAVAGSAMTLTTGERTAIATALLVLDLSTLSGEASQSMLNAVRKLRNKWSISGTTLTVYKEDGTTTAYTQTLTATAGAAPITGIGA